MAVWFVSRHPGAQDWARSQGLAIDHWCEHLDVAQVKPGDTVIGTLPVPDAADVFRQGAAYWHLTLRLPYELRGKELDVATLYSLGARLEQYQVGLIT